MPLPSVKCDLIGLGRPEFSLSLDIKELRTEEREKDGKTIYQLEY
jgi:hypothetical protein